MSGFDRDERSATGCADLVVRDQLAFDIADCQLTLPHARPVLPAIGRRRAQELDRVLGGDGARWLVSAGLLHQVPRRGPVAMAVEQRADDAAAQHSFKRFVLLARLPLGDDFIAIRKAADVQALSDSLDRNRSRRGLARKFPGYSSSAIVQSLMSTLT